MEMDSLDTLRTYDKAPAHKDWEKAYFKVREPETTSFDIIGQ